MMDRQRLTDDNALLEQYGLKNMKELWKVQTEVSRIRGNARRYLAGGTNSDEESKKLISRLSKLGIVRPETTIDNILDIKENIFLDRRLQSIVMKKGLARSAKQARQLITHGFISVNGKKVDRPGFLVSSEAESTVSYYKKIDVAPPAKQADVPAAVPPTEAPAAAA
jgi:small subunit ribosomal protein S4